LVDILTFHGFFGVKFDILKPRWLPTLAACRADRHAPDLNDGRRCARLFASFVVSRAARWAKACGWQGCGAPP
jgi:hypothetical protein